MMHFGFPRGSSQDSFLAVLGIRAVIMTPFTTCLGSMSH